MNGIALAVLIGQLPKPFGFSIGGGRPVQDRRARGIWQFRFASQWRFHGGLPHSTGLVFSST